MKKLLIFFMAVVLNCSVAIAENNLLDEEWFKKATVADVQKEIANGADVNAKDKWGETALHRAIYGDCNPDIIKLLIDAGADVNARDRNKRTVLILVAHGGSFGFIKSEIEIIKLLINAKADLNAKDENGETALQKAVQGRDSDVVKLLLEAGADVNVKDNKGKTA